MSLKPVVITPTFSGSRVHSHAYLKSSHVRGSPSDHFRSGLSVHVTVIASPLSPGALTPPFATVGTSVARSGPYRKSFVKTTSVAVVAETTLASVWLLS